MRSSEINPFRDDPDEDEGSVDERHELEAAVEDTEGYGVPSVSAGELALVVGGETPKKPKTMDGTMVCDFLPLCLRRRR